MKFICFVLILCLNILNVYGQEKKIIEISTASVSVTPEKIEQPKEQQEKTVPQVDLESLAKLLSKLVELYNNLNLKYQELSQHYDILSAKIEKYSEIQSNKIQGSSAETTQSLDKSTISQKDNLTKEETTEEISQSSQTNQQITYGNQQLSTKKTTPQYVKLKLKDKGQEIEFYLDPMYVDMNFSLIRSTVSKDSQLQFQTPQVPPETEEEKLKKQKKQTETADISQETEDVIAGIYKSQKLFYEKKYKDALYEVRKSLKKKETAIGRALEGSIYFTLGDIDSAIMSWKKAIELNPDMDDVREILRKYTQ